MKEYLVEEYAADGHGSHNCRKEIVSSLEQAKAKARKWLGGKLKTSMEWSGGSYTTRDGRRASAIIAWHESANEGCGGVQISNLHVR